MFINLSNHPSTRWESEQLVAATEFGEIFNMPFPKISPYANSSEINILAIEYYNSIAKMIGEQKDKSVVHIAGELTLCYYLIKLLLQEDYRVVVSCSERIVEEMEDNTICKKFVFTQFRKIDE